MKLAEGMYVRTRKGIIDKIVDIYYEDNYETEPFRFLLEKTSGDIEVRRRNVKKSEDGEISIYRDIITYWHLAIDISNASHNIIDLIEVGDYVNGYYVSKIWEENEITHYVDKTPIKRKEREITIQAPSYGGIIHLKNEEVKTIVTHEQMEAMQYKVVE